MTIGDYTPDIEPIQVDSFTCSCCGAYIEYKPGTTSLHCNYCGNETSIDAKIASHIHELDFEKYRFTKESINLESVKVIQCHRCNAQSTFEEKQKSMSCPYCGTAIVEADIHDERLIKPSYLLPFKVSEPEVQNCMSKWIDKLFFAPNKLKKQAIYSNHLKSIFIPYWTYDADTSTTYSGRRGDNYTVVVGSGKNRRTETRIRWRSVSGAVKRFFDDVMVPASLLLPNKVLSKLQNWDKHNYVDFDKRFLSGIMTEKYSITFSDGFETAKAIMESTISSDIRRDIGGDHQRILSQLTDYKNIKFKLILLPLFISSYTYKNKLYHFYVNGRTGQICGDRPYSAWKIFFAVLLGIIAAVAAVYFIMMVE